MLVQMVFSGYVFFGQTDLCVLNGGIARVRLTVMYAFIPHPFHSDETTYDVTHVERKCYNYMLSVSHRHSSVSPKVHTCT